MAKILPYRSQTRGAQRATPTAVRTALRRLGDAMGLPRSWHRFIRIDHPVPVPRKAKG